MIGAALPRVLGWTSFERISFYAFQEVARCALKAMSNNLELSSALMPEMPTRASMIGTFHHKLKELSFRSATKQKFCEHIEIEIANLQTLVNECRGLNVGPVSGWSEINYHAVSALKSYRERDSTIKDVQLSVEYQLRSKGGLFVGRPDFFSIQNREADLQEFKTSSLTSETGAVLSEYEQQLLFYAVLLFDNFEIDAVKGQLISIKSEKIERNISESDADEFRAFMVSRMQNINARVSAAKGLEYLANPSKESCERCNKRPICRRFLEEQRNLNFETPAFVLKGCLIKSYSDPQTLVTYLTICDEVTRGQMRIDVPSAVAAGLSNGTTYVFTNLRKAGAHLAWTQISEIYHQ